MDAWNDNNFDNQNNQGSNSPKQTNQGFENPIQGGSNDVDDFFGTESQAQPYPEVRQASPLQNQNFQSNNANQGNFNYFDQDQEKDGELFEQQALNNPQIVSHLRVIEEQRMKAIYQKEQAERGEKIKRIENSKNELNQWKTERMKNIEQRKKINRENQDILSKNKGETEFKNSWDKIVNNVAIKESDYPGSKDVSAMRTAILNKKGDVSK